MDKLWSLCIFFIHALLRCEQHGIVDNSEKPRDIVYVKSWFLHSLKTSLDIETKTQLKRKTYVWIVINIREGRGGLLSHLSSALIYGFLYIT